MRLVQNIALIGNYLPRRCGIATFTHDLHLAVAKSRFGLQTSVIAMNDRGRAYPYADAVTDQIGADDLAHYAQAAQKLNNERVDIVSLQHEYGIFGGEAGSNIVSLLDRLAMPVVTTLHTVLASPTPAQHAVMDRVIARSARVVVMAEKGRHLLRSIHAVPDAKIDVVAHGIPDFPFREPSQAKAALGFSGRSVILTFGLLSPSKGIETVIEAMPGIIEACPNALYVVLGATHPNLIRDQGEAYRECLTARVTALGIQDHVVFIDQFVDQPQLLTFISACDVYVTPYLNAAQMTSGTLAYSFGLGKAIVSTPYWHAQELLADGRGILVPFGDSAAIGHEIAALLTNDLRRHAMRKRAYEASRSMTWSQTGKRYLAAFDLASAPRATPTIRHAEANAANPPSPAVREPRALPEARMTHFLAMCDSTGLLQHAVHTVPDRHHGYCVDDNARALVLACSRADPATPSLAETHTAQFAAFIQHAWNPDTQRFRNFMSYDRRWLEDQGSEDSHGRTLWALGVCARFDQRAARRDWASGLFMRALPTTETFRSPRAWGFTLLGLNDYCVAHPCNAEAARIRAAVSSRLMACLPAAGTQDWDWFEDGLSYDNARLCQALLLTGTATSDAAMTDAGLRSLRWLMGMQTSPTGLFRPVGTDGFGDRRQSPKPFDQQPVEAAATIAACLAASKVEPNVFWIMNATAAFDWFLGANDLRTALVDPEFGSCRDGLHWDRANENCGAESVLAYHLSLIDLRQMLTTWCAPSATVNPTAVHAHPEENSTYRERPKGTQLVTTHVLQSTRVLQQTGVTSATRSGPGRRATVQAGD
jgi:glycosyltransferase involved in cell wall biosynthesis